MSRTAGALLEDALRLTESERAELAARLIESLDPEADDDVSTAWDLEIQSRLEDLDRGNIRPVPWPEARRMIMDDSDELSRA
jgi:putative addiction module component (TIGR02574 family)